MKTTASIKKGGNTTKPKTKCKEKHLNKENEGNPKELTKTNMKTTISIKKEKSTK
jgi:hypothetical protein